MAAPDTRAPHIPMYEARRGVSGPDLGVNDHHKQSVVNFLRFSRYQRSQCLRSVDACFRELRDSRLQDNETFTTDEVDDMLEGLLSVVRGEVESDLINSSHCKVLLLRQLFQQSEKWHLKLSADISELENRELLEKIADFEEQEFAGAKRDTEFNPAMFKLDPINDTGSTALLHMEIERMRDENAKMKELLRRVEDELLSVSKDKSKYNRMKDQLGLVCINDDESDELRKQLNMVQSDLEKTKLGGSKSDNEEDLIATKHELLKMKELLELAEKELENKVSMTTPYKNLKAMMMKKNDQLKVMRKRLSKYEDLDD